MKPSTDPRSMWSILIKSEKKPSPPKPRTPRRTSADESTMITVDVQPDDVLSDSERDKSLRQLKGALWWVKECGYKLPADLVTALERFETRINRMYDELNIVEMVRQAHKDGHPVTMAPGKDKTSAYEVVAKRLSTEQESWNPKTVKELCDRVRKDSRGDGLPVLPSSPKPRKP